MRLAARSRAAPDAVPVARAPERLRATASEGTSSRPAERERWRRLAGPLGAGVLVGTARTAIATSIAVLIFAGTLAPHVPAAINLALLSETVALLAVGLFASLKGTVAGVHPTPAPFAALLAAGVAASVAAPDQRFLTVVLALGLATALTGALFLIVDALRLGNVVRSVPFPVVAGFLAGTGWLLVRESFDVLTGVADAAGDLGFLFSGDSVRHWLPGVGFAVALVVVARSGRAPLAVPLGILAGVLAFYAVAGAAGSGTAELEAADWLLGPFVDADLWRIWTPDALGAADWSALPAQLPEVAALAFIAVLALLFNVTAIELVASRDADVRRELRAAGGANVVSGLAGGLVSLHTVAQTSLAYRLGVPSRIVPCAAAAVPVATLVAGPGLIALLPRPVIGGVLLFVGLTLLLDWLVASRARMSAREYVVVASLVVAIAVFGFLAGVAIGLLLALALFVLEYSRTDVLRHVVDGTAYESPTDRSAREVEVLRRHGREREYWRLQGFLFFGTGDRLVRRARERADDDRHTLRFLVIDFTQTTGIDSSAALSVVRLQRLAAERGFALVLAGLGADAQRRLAAAGVDVEDPATHAFAPLERAVEWCEDATLARFDPAARVPPTVPLAELLGDDLNRPELLRHLERVQAAPGVVLVRQGEVTDDMYLVESGVLTASVNAPSGGTLRVRRMAAGAVIGEVALLSGRPRTVSVTAETDCTLCRLSRAALDDLERNEPYVAAQLHRWLARRMAHRLADNLRTVRALLD